MLDVCGLPVVGMGGSGGDGLPSVPTFCASVRVNCKDEDTFRSGVAEVGHAAEDIHVGRHGDGEGDGAGTR